MALPNIYNQTVAQDLINRINNLTPETPANWGKMNVSQMLSHSNITYEYVFDERNDHPNFLMKFILKMFIKSKVVSETPYPQNGPTAPAFIIKDSKDFSTEKTRLINYINDVVKKGASFFEGKESSSFGVLTSIEWNNMMYKHLDHHLKQFGV
ncbi:MAG: DUF1569 domain-containing protein [Chitinophagales bacterium]|nr:DUF1569 domain-containing protein [Chitinophagales bacterium]